MTKKKEKAMPVDFAQVDLLNIDALDVLTDKDFQKSELYERITEYEEGEQRECAISNIKFRGRKLRLSSKEIDKKIAAALSKIKVVEGVPDNVPARQEQLDFEFDGKRYKLPEGNGIVMLKKGLCKCDIVDGVPQTKMIVRHKFALTKKIVDSEGTKYLAKVKNDNGTIHDYVVREFELRQKKALLQSDFGRALAISDTCADFMCWFFDSFVDINILPLAQVRRIGWYNGIFWWPTIQTEEVFEGELVNKISQKGDYAKWLLAIDGVATTHKQFAFVIGACLSAPLLEPLRIKHHSYVLNIRGQSNSSKSLAAAAGVSGYTDINGGYAFAASASKAAFESDATDAKDVLLTYDELQRGHIAAASEFAKFYCNKQTSRRATIKNGKMHTIAMGETHGVCLFTSENSLVDATSEQGKARRFFEVRFVGLNKVQQECLLDEQNGIVGNYGVALPRLIEYVCEQMKLDGGENLRQRYACIKKQLDVYGNEKFDFHIEICALSVVTLEILHEIENLKEFDALSIGQAMLAADVTRSATNEAEQIMEYAMSWIATREECFDNDNYDYDSNKRSLKCYGHIFNDNITHDGVKIILHTDAFAEMLHDGGWNGQYKECLERLVAAGYAKKGRWRTGNKQQRGIGFYEVKENENNN